VTKMSVNEIVEGVWWVGALHPDRKLFDEIIPLPDGTSYNTYLVRGSRQTALIDTVDPAKTGELVANLKELGVDRLDFVVSNHAEQDHSGSIPKILELFPEARLVTNPTCKKMLMDLLHIEEDRFQTVKDGEEMDLGGKTLKFMLAPWVHWPETMFTFLVEDNILFSCDMFGSHFSQKALYSQDDDRTLDAAKRYYAEIMMPFRMWVKKHTATVKGLAPAMIAPSHGPVWKSPGIILDAYEAWTSDETKDEILVAYISMHNSTKLMADHLVQALKEKGQKVKIFNLVEADIGELAMALVDAKTLVLGSPTFLTGPHPLAGHVAGLVGMLKPKTRKIAVFGSYGWGGRMVEQLKADLGGLNAEILEPILVKGLPREADFKALDELADKLI